MSFAVSSLWLFSFCLLYRFSEAEGVYIRQGTIETCCLTQWLWKSLRNYGRQCITKWILTSGGVVLKPQYVSAFLGLGWRIYYSGFADDSDAYSSFRTTDLVHIQDLFHFALEINFECILHYHIWIKIWSLIPRTCLRAFVFSGCSSSRGNSEEWLSETWVQLAEFSAIYISFKNMNISSLQINCWNSWLSMKYVTFLFGRF